MLQAIKLFVPVIFLLACGNKQPTQDKAINAITADTIARQVQQDTFPKATILPHIVCRNDATQSYALYIPFTNNKELLPLIYCFDPHGDGTLPLQHYKALADVFHFILIGSNNSKNGNDWATTQTILNTLFSDAQNRLAFDHNRIYTCGFSGGAKVAAYAALHQPNIKGVIASGAGLPDNEPVQNFPFHFTGMAGNGDMNMTDLVALNSALDQTATAHRLILFDGKHAWPPTDAMHTAFAALQFDAMRDKSIAVNDSLLNTYTTEAKKKTKDEEAMHQWVNAQQNAALAYNLVNGLTANADWFTKEESIVKSNPAYVQQQQQVQQLFTQEQNTKQNYQQQFGQGDMNYWTTTISNLQQKAKASTPEGAMYERLLAYLSLAFYSISNNLINNNQNQPAQHFVTLYKMADATNSEAWYFSALLNARNNDSKQTQSDLAKAASLGFTDTTRMMQQPEFIALAPQLNFPFIESNMKTAE